MSQKGVYYQSLIQMNQLRVNNTFRDHLDIPLEQTNKKDLIKDLLRH